MIARMRRLPRRRVWCAAALAAGAAWPAAASADVVVHVNFPAMTVQVEPAGATNAHRVSLQYFEDSRRGVRLQQLGFGDPTIRSPDDAFCDTNPLFNDVVCSEDVGLTGPDTIAMGAGDDTVAFIAPALTFAAPCVAGQNPVTPVSMTLGAGDDRVTTVPPTCGAGRILDPTQTGATRPDEFNPRFTSLDGGAGNDRIQGGSFDDVLSGGTGNDSIDGGSGDDTIVGGPGNDAQTGGPGDDSFHESAEGGGANGSDTIRGGPGTDTVDYSRRTTPLTITVGDLAHGDGAAGEGDGIADADVIIGGSAGDTITGSSAPETLQGRGGDDTIDAVDGTQDAVSCGDGNDVATLDLKDTVTLHFVTAIVLGQPRQVLVPDCERITRQAVDDSPPGRPAARALRLAGDTASIRFRCPASARPGCRGTLVVRDARRGGRVLGRTGYVLGVGTSATLDVPLRPGAAATLRGTRTAVVATTERGHSRIGPRRSTTVVRVRGS
jgi:hypothetical protein